jgi:hypothetical protein
MEFQGFPFPVYASIVQGFILLKKLGPLPPLEGGGQSP